MKRQGENTRPYTFILEQTVVFHKDAVILNTEISIGNGIGCFHITLYSDENRRRGKGGKLCALDAGFGRVQKWRLTFSIKTKERGICAFKDFIFTLLRNNCLPRRQDLLIYILAGLPFHKLFEIVALVASKVKNGSKHSGISQLI